MLSPGNVATPATAATVVVPERVPLPGFAPSAIVTLPVKPVAVFPCPSSAVTCTAGVRSEEHTSELQSQSNLVCRLLLEKKKKTQHQTHATNIPRAVNTHLVRDQSHRLYC